MKQVCTVFVMILALLLSACGYGAGKAWQKQYDLGRRYLSEGHYEQAIIAFTDSIEADPNQPGSYFGRGQSYYEVARLIMEGENVNFSGAENLSQDPLSYCYEQSIQDYEKAIALDPQAVEYYDIIIKAALEHGDLELVVQYGELKYQYTDDTGLRDLFEAAKESLEVLDELANAFAGGDDEKIFTLLQGDKYTALLSLQEYLGAPILRTYGDRTLGVYRVDTLQYGSCMIYYGNCKDEKRSGQGAWYGYHNGNRYASHGNWENDMPNGAFEAKEWNDNMTETAVCRRVSGNVIDGLWDGSVLWAFDNTDGTYQSWNCTFQKGKAEIVKTEETDGVTYYFWSERSNEGDPGLASSEGTAGQLQGIVGFVPDLQ